MKKELNNLIFTFLIVCSLVLPCSAKIEASGDTFKRNGNFFDLFSIAGNILNSAATQGVKNEVESLQSRQAFIETTNKFKQGNVTVAYSEYLNLIPKLKNDIELLNLSKFLYKNGLFSLSELALSKIKRQDGLRIEIADLKKSYGSSFPIDKNEEIYLAKALMSIYFDNSALETTYDLNKKTNLMENSDYANYVMAQAFYELKQYNQSLNCINTALSINPQNATYSYYKAKILFANKEYSQALKLTEISNLQTLNLKNDFFVLKQNILSHTVKNQSEHKLHVALAAYYDANYYKAINNAKTAIGLDKKNYKALNLLGKSQLKIGEVSNAKYNFDLSNSIKKSNPDALVGLGDCEFINKNFDKANNFYKKAYSKEANNAEITIKLILVSEILNDEKSIVKYENALAKVKNGVYFENFEVATTLLNNIVLSPDVANTKLASRHVSDNLKIEYLKASLYENPFFTGAWLELTNSGVNPQGVQEGFLRIATFSGDFNYFYFYNLALVEYAQDNYVKTIEYLNTTTTLNPQFEPANAMLLNLKIR